MKLFKNTKLLLSKHVWYCNVSQKSHPWIDLNELSPLHMIILSKNWAEAEKIDFAHSLYFFLVFLYFWLSKSDPPKYKKYFPPALCPMVVFLAKACYLTLRAIRRKRRPVNLHSLRGWDRIWWCIPSRWQDIKLCGGWREEQGWTMSRGEGAETWV